MLILYIFLLFTNKTIKIWISKKRIVVWIIELDQRWYCSTKNNYDNIC